jgi:hypothetical protein
MAADKVHSHKPLSKRNLSVLEDSANKYRELSLTALADIATILADVGMRRTTVRTYGCAITPTLLGNGCFADFLRREEISNLNERVELCEVNVYICHKSFL